MLCFLCRPLQINTTSVERDRSNPFRFPNIGVEKFLELNSEQNHDDYCLAYVFTDRDFDDGVLGLAWVGAPAGTAGECDILLTAGSQMSLQSRMDVLCSAFLCVVRTLLMGCRRSTVFILLTHIESTLTWSESCDWNTKHDLLPTTRGERRSYRSYSCSDRSN